MDAQKLEKLVSRLELATERLEKMQSHTSGVSGATIVHDTAASSPSIVAYDGLLNGALKTFLDNSAKLSPDVKTIADMVKKVFDLQRSLLVEVARSAKPATDVFAKALEPISKQIQDVTSFRDKNRRSEFFNHFSAISESVGAVGWVQVEPAPAPFIKELTDAAQFYTNKVLKDYREKDKNHVTWVQNWLQVLIDLQAYVKQYHTTGLAWNARGGHFDPNNTAHSKPTIAPKPNLHGSPAGTKAAAPPPPPPIPSFNDLFADDKKGGAGDTGGADLQAKLKQELNMGTDITKSLKKVSADQMTHKNPSLRAGSTVPMTSPSAKSETTSAKSTVVKPPKFELVDKKWCIEYQENRTDLVVKDVEIKQTVYIYKCKNCTVKVQGKVNSISLDLCDRVSLLFDDVLSTVEFINSKNVQAQVIGKVPTISIDKTDGCQFFLSKDSVHAVIVTAKSSAVNILLPPAKEGDDYVEHPIPEQFKTVFENGKAVTVPVESG